jgi:hypothetical protein
LLSPWKNGCLFSVLAFGTGLIGSMVVAAILPRGAGATRLLNTILAPLVWVIAFLGFIWGYQRQLDENRRLARDIALATTPSATPYGPPDEDPNPHRAPYG